MEKLKMTLMLTLLGVTATGILRAADAKKTAAPDAAMMQSMIKMGMPNENHKVLEPTVGKWTCVVKMWMQPGDQPQMSTGTSVNTWELGGRYLKQSFVGNWAGQYFEGFGYTGYDNIRGEYQSIWMDNFATGMMQSAGTYDAATKTITTEGTFSCPMGMEKRKWVRSALKIIDNNTNIYTSYFKGTDGKEFKSMEIVYTRIK